MKTLIILFSICLIISGCASKPSPRGKLYWADSALIIADGISTSRARNNGAVETGYTAVRTIGKHPSDAQIIGFTAANLLVLESSRYWNPDLRMGYQWSILITRPGIIQANLSISLR